MKQIVILKDCTSTHIFDNAGEFYLCGVLHKFRSLSLPSQGKHSSPKYLGGPPLNLLQFTNVFLVLGSWMWSLQCAEQTGVIPFLNLLAVHTAQDKAGGLGWLMLSLLLAQTHRGLSGRPAASQLVSAQPVLLKNCHYSFPSREFFSCPR